MLSDYGKDYKAINYFEALEHRNGYNINKNKLQKNKEEPRDIYFKSNDKKEEMKK